MNIGKLIRNHQKNISLVKFLLPALILYCLFVIYPFINGLYYSFTDWDGMSPDAKWVGLKNYVKILGREDFLGTIYFTVKFTVTTVIMQNVGALLLAVALDSITSKFRNTLRGVFYIPNIMAQSVVAFIWTFVFTKGFESLYKIFGFEFLNWSWFGDGTLAFWVIVIVSNWIGTGYLMIIYIAGLQGIPQNFIEASMIDGANPIQRFFRIKLPFIMPAFVIGIFSITMYGFRQFDIVFFMTMGKPYGQTETIAFKIYQTAYDLFKFGESSAQSVVLLLFSVIVTFLEVYYLKKMEVEA